MELSTEDYFMLVSENTSLGPVFNLTNDTIIEEDNNDATLLATSIYLTIIGFFAILGNVTVLTIIFRDKKLRSKPHNHLLISLAFCDLSVMFFGYPFTLISAWSRKWMFGEMVCTFAGFFTFFVSLTSMNILVAICLFRYVMICLPGKSFLLTPKFTFYVILGSFAYGFFWTALPLLGWGSYAMEPFIVSCSLNWAKHDFSNISYMVATIFFCYIGHIAIMVNCYRHISKTVTLLAQRDRERGRIVREDEMLYRSKVADDQQVTRMCFLVVIVFAGVWAPYTFVCAIHIFYELPIYMTALPTLFAKSSCMMNPMVYFLTNRNFRVKAMEIVGCSRMDNIVGVETPNGTLPYAITTLFHLDRCYPGSPHGFSVPLLCNGISQVVRTFDKLSKDGVYLGQDKVVMEKSSTMF